MAHGSGKMIRLADGRKVKKLFDAQGRPVEIHKATRSAPAFLRQRNQLVRELMAREGLSIGAASAAVKARGLWQR